MSTSASNLLAHIRDEAAFLRDATANVSPEAFSKDEVLKRACARSIQVIGEATRKIPQEVKDRYPEVEWNRMAGMRNRVVHEYFGVDYSVVYQVARSRASELFLQMESAISREGKQKTFDLEP